jgi:Protein of unknown function (DUF1761)
MTPNFLVIGLSSLIPLIVGFVWYNEKVAGKIWMQETGITPEDGKKLNMTRILIANVVLGFLLAMGLSFIVIHQGAIYSILANEPSLQEAGSPLNTYVADFMAKYGNNFRTFKHGVVHGFGTSITLGLPLIAVGALWEGKSWKYIGIQWGYWAITMMLMGGVICAFA